MCAGSEESLCRYTAGIHTLVTHNASEHCIMGLIQVSKKAAAFHTMSIIIINSFVYLDGVVCGGRQITCPRIQFMKKVAEMS